MSELITSLKRVLARWLGTKQANGFYLWRGKLYPPE